uniref:Uncharacterized protein n=1 Tax=Anguilla anguilla TaxID=7936 RepID=A0A0E9W6D1_ANGAN
MCGKINYLEGSENTLFNVYKNCTEFTGYNFFSIFFFSFKLILAL